MKCQSISNKFKLVVASHIQGLLEKGVNLLEQQQGIMRAENIDQTEITAINILETQIKITFKDGKAPKYYRVKVSEQI